MSLLLAAEKVTIVRAGAATEDAYGNSQPGWATATRTDVWGTVQPLSSSEDVVNLDRTVTRWRLFLPPGADITARDRVEWQAGTFEVDGDVERWSARGAEHHVEAVLQRITEG